MVFESTIRLYTGCCITPLLEISVEYTCIHDLQGDVGQYIMSLYSSILNLVQHFTGYFFKQS